MGGFIRLNTEIDGLTFLYSYSTMSLCHEEISNLYLYKDETLLSLSEAYEKEYVNYDQLEYAWETYYLCRYSKEYLEELKNQPIKLEEMTNKAIEFFPQFIENYNDNDYKLEINIMEYPSHRVEKIPAMMLDYQAYEILKMNKIDVCKNGELINTVYVGYTMGEEDKIWLMISVSTDNSINYIRVLEQHETDYPYEDDYDFDLIGAKYEEFSQFIPGPNYTGPQLKYFIVTSSQDALSAVYRFAQYLLEKNN